jgi:hypothetical protein
VLTTYEHDEQGRLLRAFTASAWTEEDRALLLARDAYLATLCSGCGQPKETAWHPDNEGWFEVTQSFECNACTALRRESDPSSEPVTFHAVTDTRDYEKSPLPPLPTGPRMSPEELAVAMGGAD